MRHCFLDSLSHLFQLLAITGRPLSSQNLLMLTSANMSDPDCDTPGWFGQEFGETPRHIVAHHTAVTRSTVAPSPPMGNLKLLPTGYTRPHACEYFYRGGHFKVVSSTCSCINRLAGNVKCVANQEVAI